MDVITHLLALKRKACFKVTRHREALLLPP